MVRWKPNEQSCGPWKIWDERIPRLVLRAHLCNRLTNDLDTQEGERVERSMVRSVVRGVERWS